MRFIGSFILLFGILASSFEKADAGQFEKISATPSEIIFRLKATNPPVHIFEFAPFSKPADSQESNRVATISKKGDAQVSIPRFDGARDRIYSGFVAEQNGAKFGALRFVDDFDHISKNTESYPSAKSKKGLQVEMVDDAIALGVKHAALNFNLGYLVALEAAPDDCIWPMDGREFHFRRSYIEAIDKKVKSLSDSGALVSLILLNYEGSNAGLNALLLHPNYDHSCPNNLSAFNTSTPEGVAWFKAAMEFLAARYSEKNYPQGRVVNYIVGNEVNSHWYWANMGRVSMEEFARDYLRTMRICHTAVRKFSSSARVFISLEHHWNIRYPGCDEKQGFAARPFLEYFNKMAKEGGSFDWNIAFHPYPENLFEPRTWNDKTATFDDDTPRITFKNIGMLTAYFRRKEMLFHGKPRRIILSEQGFHSDGTAEGELAQAAAYCYAYYKVDRLDGIDAFILHRHVDNANEGGLNLGLWRRDPRTKKPIYNVFRDADTPEWEKAFEFALPIIGIKSWKEIEPHVVKK